MHHISVIEEKLKRSGTAPESLLHVQAKRSYLDKLRIPKKVRIETLCCKVKASYLFCMLGLTIIDFFVLLKYILQIVEMAVYKSDYP